MTTRTKISAALVALSLAGIAATTATAQTAAGNDAVEAQAFGSAAVTLAQAVTAAEAQTGGKVMSAEFDAGDAGEPAAYDVEVVMADGSMMDMVVNAADGTVGQPVETNDDNGQANEDQGMEGDDDDGGDDEDDGENGGENEEG